MILRNPNILIGALLLGAAALVSAQPKPVVWFHPRDPIRTAPEHGSYDFFDLFIPEAPWKAAASRIDGFGLWPYLNIYSEEQMRYMIADLNRRGFAIAYEAGILTSDPSCESEVEGYGFNNTLAQLRQFKALGADIRHFSIDEPLSHTQIWGKGWGCDWPVRKTATDAARNAAILHEIYPDMQFGLVEMSAYEGGSPAHIRPLLAEFVDVWREVYGTPLAHLTIEVNPHSDWRTGARGVRKLARDRGIPFGLFYRGWGESPTNDEWIGEGRTLYEHYETRMDATPEHVWFQSWDNFPNYVLPETSPSTFTGFINSYFRERTVLTAAISGGRATGKLSTQGGAPIANAVVSLGARHTTGAGVIGEYRLTGTGPEGAVKAVVQTVVDHAAGVDVDVVSVRSVPAATGTGVTYDFTRGLTGWSLSPSRTVTPVVANNLLQIRTTKEEYLWVNSPSFPMTPGVAYDIRVTARVSAGSTGAGFFRLIHLDAARKELGHRYAAFEPALMPLTTAHTGADGTFQEDLNPAASLKAPGVVLEAVYEGSDTRWPAFAATPLNPAPSIARNGVVSGASFEVKPLAPGHWLTIFGQNLGTQGSWNGPETTTLGGARVTICSEPAAISFNSGPLSQISGMNWQLNVLVPDTAAGKSSCPVVVTVNGQESATVVDLSSAAAELFTVNLPTGALPAVTHADYSLIGPTEAGLRPATPGETVIAWGTGNCANPAVRAGGKTAIVVSAQRVAPGLCQTNFIVPDAIDGLQTLEFAASTYFFWLNPGPPAPPFDGWRFSQSDIDRWVGHQVTGMRLENGLLTAQSTGTDPQFTSPMFAFPASRYSRVAVRMSISANSTAAVYWTSIADASFTAAHVATFTAMAGGIREYIVPIGQHPDWKEFITRIRLDPTTQAGVDVQVESILFLP